jgi:hypothetical protein
MRRQHERGDLGLSSQGFRFKAIAMTRFASNFATCLLLFTLTPNGALADEAGALTPGFLTELREGYEMNAGDRARHNAVANNPVKSLALSRSVIRGDDGHFSHRIKSKGITNQKKSGRCWMFAGLNVVRPPSAGVRSDRAATP